LLFLHDTIFSSSLSFLQCLEESRERQEEDRQIDAGGTCNRFARKFVSWCISLIDEERGTESTEPNADVSTAAQQNSGGVRQKVYIINIPFGPSHESQREVPTKPGIFCQKICYVLYQRKLPE